MVLFSRPSMASIVFVLVLPVIALSQAVPTASPAAKPSPTASPVQQKFDPKNPTAEQIVESTILVFAFPGGRPVLDQIRKTTIERGTTTVTGADGKAERAAYQRYIIRGSSIDAERIRLDQEFPSVRYSLVKNADKVFMIYNDSIYNPREDAALSFRNQNYRGLDGLLRYKENGSKIELAGKETKMGVEYHMIDVTDKDGHKTRYHISAKRFRVLMLEYDENGSKFKRKFYDYNLAQGTLVPYKSVLYRDDKIVEETEIGTITFGQKVDESLFPAGTS